MKEFDVIVIGAGSGLGVASAAANADKRVAIIDDGPMGGTCLNRGCIPSKMVIHSADVAETIDRAGLFGIATKGYGVDFAKITKRASSEVDGEAKDIENSILSSNIELYKEKAKFTDERTVAVGNKSIRGRYVVVAAGTRPSVPPIEGIENVKYMTSDEALRLTKQPKSMIVLGGGFIAAELAHFYGALGTKVTIIQRSVLLRQEDREIADLFTKSFGKKHKIVLGYGVKSVEQKGSRIVLAAQSKDGSKMKKLEADALLVATGRVPNTDVLQVSKGKIETNEHGYVKTNEYLETSAENTWALGDIAGKYLLKHSANLEARYVRNAIIKNERKPVDYWPMPHAIFTSPQIAAVGYTEDELREKKTDYAAGKYHYKDTGMGLALAEQEGFVKILADRNSRKILGCHIIGPEAASIIHEVIVAMKLGATTDQLTETVHIHPAMPEVVQRAAAAVVY